MLTSSPPSQIFLHGSTAVPHLATSDDHAQLLDIWESAVRATHLFLSESDITTLRTEIPAFFSQVDLWVIDLHSNPAGFMGVSQRHIEMLFIDPLQHKKGLGSALIGFAITHYGLPLTVDVNEQNPSALAFYLHRGFELTGRSTLDRQGRAFPLLHLRMT